MKKSINDLIDEQQSEREVRQLLEKSGLTPDELKIVLKSALKSPESKEDTPKYSLQRTKWYKFGLISDTHIGHNKFDEGLLAYSAKIFKREKIEDVYHSGDIVEGLSRRGGHIYELETVGFEAQVSQAADLFSKHFSDFNIIAITGNHDHWYRDNANNGASVGKALHHRLKNLNFLGEDEGDVIIKTNSNKIPEITIKLFHPNDGSAYAISYKMQKLVESLEGGHKPHVILSGHYHKALYMFSRNVHGFESGTLCSQTRWMRGKKIAAMKGFWVIELGLGERGIEECRNQFFPAYD
jgi:predicted phosphodiesterase